MSFRSTDGGMKSRAEQKNAAVECRSKVPEWGAFGLGNVLFAVAQCWQSTRR